MNDKIAVGRSVLRREDRRFLTGTGQFTDDTYAPEALHAFVLRSPHAHANILGIDTARALHSSGVVGVFLAADLEAAGVAAIPCQTQVLPMAVRNRDGSLVPLADQYALARGKVRRYFWRAKICPTHFSFIFLVHMNSLAWCLYRLL